jgi:hypothetical protein
MLIAIKPKYPGESRAGAQDREQEGEGTVCEVVEPGSVHDEPGGDGDGGEHEEQGHGEHRLVRRTLGGVLWGFLSKTRHV